MWARPLVNTSEGLGWALSVSVRAPARYVWLGPVDAREGLGCVDIQVRAGRWEMRGLALGLVKTIEGLGCMGSVATSQGSGWDLLRKSIGLGLGPVDPRLLACTKTSSVTPGYLFVVVHCMRISKGQT